MSERRAGRYHGATLVGLALMTAVLGYRLGTPVLFDEPNDGQYAEVAREMVEGHEWVSPSLNGVLFLNKPPLLYWLIATAYTASGVNELAARLPGVLATLMTTVLLACLGQELYDKRVGLLAALIYFAMPATFVEARFARPDSLVVAATTGAVLAVAIALRCDGASRRRALVGLQVALAAGVMAKGFVALLLAALPAAALLIAMRRWDALRWLKTPHSWRWFLLLVVPWHALVAWRHPGFVWDYLVNQHVLFFFDQKLPRDSVPIPLGAFWGAFAGRLFPWTIFVPSAVVYSALRLRHDPAARVGSAVLLVWAGGTLAFFSSAVSRLEHYALPALPPTALLLAAYFAALDAPGARRRGAAAGLGIMLTLALGGVWYLPRVLRADTWLASVSELPWLAMVLCGIFAAGFAVALAVIARSARLAAAAVVVASVATVPLVHRGLQAIAPMNSSAPIAQLLDAGAEGSARIVYEAPIEYQSCAGLAFYLRHPVTLLRPEGFVAPTYLLPHLPQLFIERPELEALWRQEPVLFISNPLAPADRPLDALVPAPFFVRARVGNRWVISNRPRT